MSDARLDACHGKAFALLAAIFIAGFASGLIGMRVYDARVAAAPPPAQTIDLTDQSVWAVDYLSGELGLEPAQAERLKVILDESIMAEADLLMQIRSIQQRGRQRIFEILDQEQREKFETIVQTVSDRR